MRYGFIYETTNNINGMKYIGKCIYGRINNWETYLGSGTYLKKAIEKYGKENFTREIICEADSDEELNSLEEHYILERNAVDDPRYYNLKLTAIGGDTFTDNPNKERTRMLKSINATGKRNSQYNKPKSDKMIEAVRKANSKEVVVEGKLYPSMTQASRELGIGVTTIAYRLDSEAFPTYIRIHPKGNQASLTNKPVRVSIEGTEYESMAEASRQLGCSKAMIRGRIALDDFPDWFTIEMPND